MRLRPFSGPRSRRTSKPGRRRLHMVEALEGRIALTQLAIGLFDTGVDANGAVLAGGAADLHYTLPVTQQGTPGQNAVVVSMLDPAWVANSTTSRWISSSPDQANSTSPPGFYRYSTTFNVPTIGNGGQVIGNIAVDPLVNFIDLNGVQTSYSQLNSSTSFVPFSVSAGLVQGLNTLTFYVVNQAPPPTASTGLQVKDLALNLIPALTIDNASRSTGSGGSILNGGTFDDLDDADTVTITSSRGTVSQSGTNNGTYSYFEANVTTGGTVTITATDSRGGVKTSTFEITVGPNQPPVLTGSGQPTTFRTGSPGVAVDPNLTIADPDGPNLTTASVSIGSNFTPSEDRLLFTSQNGITGSYNTSTGTLSLNGSATAAQYQAALRSVQYRNLNASTANRAPRSISFSIAPGAYNPVNGHFYEFVASQGLTWTDAKASAGTRTIFGLRGYLATLTSAAENNFAFSKTQSVGWIGASDAAVEGEWRWADGPENGQQFWQGLSTGGPVAGRYNNWAAGEPNNADIENYAHLLASGLWNDFANATPVQGFVVEYGGLAGDPTPQLTSLSTVNVANPTPLPTVTSPSAPRSVNTPTIAIQGSTRPGSLVRIYTDANNNGVIDAGDDVVSSQQLSGSATSFSLAVPLAPNATNNFLVTAQAAPDLESNPVDVPTVTADTIAPTVPTVTSPDRPTTLNAETTTIVGQAEADSFVQIYNDVNNNGVLDGGDQFVGDQQLAGGATSYSIVVPLAQDAENHFLVTATDLAGNASGPVLVPTLTEDSTALAVPTVTVPASATTVNTATATIAGSAEPGSLVTVYADANNNGVLDGGEVVIGTQQLTPLEAGYSIVVPLSPNEVNGFLVTATDQGLNESATVVVPPITQDSITPLAPTVTMPATPTTVGTPTATIGGEAEPGSLVEVYDDANGNGLIDETEVIVGSQQLEPGATSYSIAVPLATDSENRFLVMAIDAGGNDSAAVAVPTITQDSTSPGLPSVTSPATSGTLGTSTVTIVGEAEPGSLVEVYDDANGNGVLDEGEPVVGSLQLEPGQTSYSITVPLAPNATNNFLVAATDAGGNRSVPVVVPTITQDSISPAAPTVIKPDAATPINASTVTIVGEAEAGSLVLVYADANTNGVIDEGEVVVGFQQLAPGQTTYSITVPLAADSENRFLVTATDAGGNESVAVVVPTITEDSIAPADFTVTSPGTTTTTNGNTALISGIAEAGSLVQIFDDANSNGVIDEGELVVGLLQLAPGSTSYSIVVPLATDSENRFLITTTDAAGNRSEAVVVPTITQVSTAPIVGSVFLDYDGDGVRNGQDQGFSGRRVFFDANANGEFDAGETSTSTDVDGGYRFEGVAAGPYTVRVDLFPSERMTGVSADGRRVEIVAGRPVQDADLGLRLFNPAFPVATTADPFALPQPNEPSAAVSGLYLGVLGRQAGEAEIRFWTDQLRSGMPFADVVQGFLDSDEYLGNQVDGLYRIFLDRDADAAGRADWISRLRLGMSQEELAAGFLNSEEYRSLHADPADFVRSLYRDELGRVGGDEEVQRFVSAMQSGTTRESVVAAFLNSQEAHLRAIDSVYAQFLGRAGEDSGRAVWLNFIDNGGDLDEMAALFLTLPEFTAKARASLI